ncbi:MAG: leucine-rich repeat domain-containing protein [Bacteroidaceae bacterium]|nr:leucine-rich repeat domain-containing protein [Bacteroidaceae bacterium]
MRKFLTLFSLMLTTIVGTANADYYVSGRLAPSEIQEGDYVIFEAASTTVNYGYYLKESGGTYAWTQGLDETAIWIARPYTAGDFKYGSSNCWAFQNLSTGNYMGGTNSNPVSVSDATQQVGVKMYGVGSPWVWQDYSNQSSYPRGWDDSSTNMRGFSEVNSGDWWYANDVGNKSTGALPNAGGLHNWAWNVFKVSTSTGTPFSVYTGESTSYDDVVIDGLYYNLAGIYATPSGAITSGTATLNNSNRNNTTLTSVHIPAIVTYNGFTFRVTSILNGAFQGGTFSTLTFDSPCNFTSLGDRTFYNCNNVTKVELPEGVTTLSAWRAFSTMASLVEIKLPESITTIADHSFSSDPSLKRVIFKGTTPPSVGTWDVFGETTVPGNISIIVPTEASLSSYQSHTNLNSYGTFQTITAIPNEITLHQVGDDCWGTMYVPFGVTLPDGTEAYVGAIDSENNTIRLTNIGQDVPAGTAVVLKGNAASISGTINDNIAEYTGSNALVGQYLAASAANDNIRALGTKDGVIGFYKLSSALGANKAYLDMTSTSPGFKIVIDDDNITGISESQSLNAGKSQSIYDLYGRKVAAPQKGQLYIQNGKKVIY